MAKRKKPIKAICVRKKMGKGMSKKTARKACGVKGTRRRRRR